MLCKRIKLTGNLQARHLWLGLTAVCALLAGGGVMASPADAATVTKEHVCKVIGDNNLNNGSPYQEAVVCTDLLQFGPDGNGNYYAESRTQGLCQTSTGTTVRCPGIIGFTEAARTSASGTVLTSVGWASCGVNAPQGLACPADSRLYATSGRTLAARCLPNVWAVSLGGIMATRIELPLPGGQLKIVRLLADFGTPHASIGDC
jgi:hypothetical protein